ncbi:hypothetical protein LV779_26855 [Streptomyces thinghirensis]|nr:hypothetical protein [Streptomyces thinghirensis]
MTEPTVRNPAVCRPMSPHARTPPRPPSGAPRPTPRTPSPAPFARLAVLDDGPGEGAAAGRADPGLAAHGPPTGLPLP